MSPLSGYLPRITVVLATAAALLAPAVAVGVSTQPAVAATAARSGTPAPAIAVGRSPKRPFAVGVRTYTFVDTSRPTPANNGVPAKPTRTLITTVFYPAAGPTGGPDVTNAPPARRGAPYPLIVFSHGFTANGPAYGLLLRRFAEAGYVVAAPTFPLSSGSAPGGPTISDYIHQPADVSFVITQMLRVDRVRGTGLTHVIDSHRIGVAGHSLGAITTLGLLNTCCIDRRIDAAVSISGIELPFPGGSFTYQRRTPLLLIHGDADHTVPYAGSVNVFAHAHAPKFFLTLLGAPHTPFFGPHEEAIVRSMTDFFDRYLKHERGSLIRLFSDAQVPKLTTLQFALR